MIYDLLFFFFNDPATTEIYTLSLHDALPIFLGRRLPGRGQDRPGGGPAEGEACSSRADPVGGRSEEHTSELQSRQYLVCRLLLEKKKEVSIDLPSLMLVLYNLFPNDM